MRWEAASFVQLPWAFKQKNKYRIENRQFNQIIWKIDSLTCKKLRPCTEVLGKEQWAEDQYERRWVRPSIVDSTHNFPSETLRYSPHFLYFCEFHTAAHRALLDLGWTLCFASSAFAEAMQRCLKCPLLVKQRYFVKHTSWQVGLNSRHTKGPLETYSNFKGYKIFTIFLARSEDILPTLSQLHKFFEKGLMLWNSENQLMKSHIL